MSAPAAMPSMELATASSQSLCVWMPVPVLLPMEASRSITASTPARIFSGRLPPFVSHSTTHAAPACAAAAHTSSA